MKKNRIMNEGRAMCVCTGWMRNGEGTRVAKQ